MISMNISWINKAQNLLFKFAARNDKNEKEHYLGHYILLVISLEACLKKKKTLANVCVNNVLLYLSGIHTEAGGKEIYWRN